MPGFFTRFRRKCNRCGIWFIANTRNAKYCAHCSDFLLNNPLSLEDLKKAERRLEKNIMALTNVKVYGSPSYRPMEREKPYFERRDPSFLRSLIGRR
jgi:ribosomal protein S27AE